MKKIDLNAPAFGENAVKLEDVAPVTSETPTDAPQAKEEVESKEEEQRVPYSRFETVRQQKEDAIREAQEATERLRELEARQSRPTVDDSPYEEAIRNRVIKLYGDNDVSKEIIEIELSRQRQIEEAAERRALEAVRADRENEVTQVRQNENIIDMRIDDLAEALGRNLTAKEEEALLDVVDEYTPKNADGSYAGETIPFDKAWEIVEMRNAQKSASASKSREVPTFLSGTRTEGEPNTDTQKEWRGGWNNYQERFRN